MTPERRHLHQTAQLSRLRELRRSQAQAQARQAREAQASALATARATQAQVHAHQGERQALLQQMTQGSLLPRWGAQAQARRDFVEDRLERAECALIDDEEALHTADRQLDQANAVLRSAWARNDATQDELRRARVQLAAAGERRAEREDPCPIALPPGVLR